MTYDNLDRTARLTDPDGSEFLSASTTHYYYDFLDRIISKQDANSGTPSYTYDGVNDLLSLKNPVGNDTTWSYDPLNRITIETNEARSFVYDAMRPHWNRLSVSVRATFRFP